MSYFRLPFILLTCFVVLNQARAEETTMRYNQVSLTATVTKEVVPDLLRITLYSENRDVNAARLAEATTKKLNIAIEKARQMTGVTVQSGNRHSAQTRDKKALVWRERAELHLESHDFAALAALSGQLSNELNIAGQYFLISKPRQKEIENQLIEEAIAAFDERAQLVTKALVGNSYKIINLNIDNSGRNFPIIARYAMEEMVIASPMGDGITPHIEAGTREVTVSVSGIIEIEP